MSFQSFATGLFSQADLQNLRNKSGKSETLLAIGQQLRQTRITAKLARSEIASRCGMSVDRLGRFEHGVNDMDFQSLDKLCTLLGVDIADLLSGFMKMNTRTAITLITLARSWTANGKSLSVENMLAMPDPTTGKHL